MTVRLSTPLFLLMAALWGCGGSQPSPDASPDGAADGCRPLEGEPELDGFGGDRRLSLEATGFFRAERLCRRWWLVTPEGHPFYSLGVNHITPRGDEDRTTGERIYEATVDATYPSRELWADEAVERLREWGFNTAGSWSDQELFLPRMPFTRILGLSGGDWQTGQLADWFDPDWESFVADQVAELAPLRDEPNLIGYFLDNEIRWGPDWRGNDTLLQAYLSLGPEAAGKEVAVSFLLDELGGIEGVNEILEQDHTDRAALLAATDTWGRLTQGASATEARLTSGFLRLAAERYFSVTTNAVRATDPDHLILGNREVSIMTRLEVYQAAAAHVDVISINNYVFPEIVIDTALAMSRGLDPSGGFVALHREVDLPILITEFGFRAADSSLPNSWPPVYPIYETQEERADAFAEYALLHQEIPWIVGYHWFEWVDQPLGGRFDGEDNNWGLVNEHDEPYSALTWRMHRVNQETWGHLLVPANGED